MDLWGTYAHEHGFDDDKDDALTSPSCACCVDCGAPLQEALHLVGSRVLTFPVEHVCES